MGKIQPKHKVVSICRGNDPAKTGGSIIRIVEQVPPSLNENSQPQEWKDFYTAQGEALGMAILDAAPGGTIVSMISFIHGVLKRVQTQNNEEGE